MADIQVSIGDFLTVYVNSHSAKKVLNEETRNDIKKIPGVIEVIKYGTYGMELIIVIDNEDGVETVTQIAKTINLNKEA